MTIAIVDYGMGNLRSVEKALEKVGGQPLVTRDPEAVRSAQAVVLPGVGAFGACMENLRKYGLDKVVLDVIERGTPFFGICLGMQLLFEESEEFGPVHGLGVLPGRVVRFPASAERPVPHMGWNQIRVCAEVPHLRNVADGSFVYFVHSYYVVPANGEVVATTTEYGVEFASAVHWKNIFATQYHPEKSQRVGLALLRNFVEAVVRGS
ncbi:MAG: imidazole glycerol phosphate synthase subunit HisH [candidate division KSB1 bacterium]|nr:imidazole glycerol phosphate synthase subunit HisH [candidate division KSB1 bacterium]